MGDYGMKISKEGFDILTADDDELIFTNKFPLQQIALQGTITVTGTPSNYVTSSVDHNLGYRPAFLSWVRDPYLTNDPTVPSYSTANHDVYVDDDKIYFEVYWNGGSNQDFVFYYYVFVDDAQ